jgi:hypothetical protein
MEAFGENPVNPSLADLPPELLHIVIGLLSAASQRSLAGTCAQLRASVLLQAKQLRLHLGSSQYTTTAALLAATRRKHGPAFHLKLRLMGGAFLDKLRALDNCPDVDQLELEFIPVSRYTTVSGNRGSIRRDSVFNALLSLFSRLSVTRLFTHTPAGCGELDV